MAFKTEQQIVYDWLNDTHDLPVFAEAYKGAVILLNEKAAGYVSFVAHVGRDLMNQLASTVAGVKAGRVQYQQHIDKLRDVWQDDWRYSDDLSPEVVENGHPIPIKVCKIISTLIDEHNSGRIRSSKVDGLFFSTFLDYSDKRNIPDDMLFEWKSARKWFLSHAHLRKESFQEDTCDVLAKHFNCLDGYLYIAASSQYKRLRELDEILEATNK